MAKYEYRCDECQDTFIIERSLSEEVQRQVPCRPPCEAQAKIIYRAPELINRLWRPRKSR